MNTQQTQNHKQIMHYVFSEDKKLGEGAFGVVLKGINKQTNRQVAVKVIQKSKYQNDPQVTMNVQREIQIMRDLKHPNILQLLDFTQTQNNQYIILEYCGNGDLLSCMKKQPERRFSEEIAIKYFRQIVEGFKELHSRGIIHRDIKPANILLDKDVAKISDFGFARFLEHLNQQQKLTILGSPLYMSPQILSLTSFSSKCDIWSLGVMFYEMIYGRTPWQAQTPQDLYKKIVTYQEIYFPNDIKSSYNTKDIIMRMLKVREEDRISWEEVFDHHLMVDADQYQLEHIVSNNINNIIKIDGIFNPTCQFYQTVLQQLTNSNQQMMEGTIDENQVRLSEEIIKLDSMVLHDRNTHIIKSILAYQIYRLKINNEIPFSNQLYLNISIILIRLFIIYMESWRQFMLRDSLQAQFQQFTNEQFLQYKQSALYQRTLAVINKDLQEASEYQSEIIRKIKNLYKNLLVDQAPEQMQALANMVNSPEYFNPDFYQNVTNNVILSLINFIKSPQQINDNLRKQIYDILKLCQVVSEQNYFTFDKDNINTHQFVNFYTKYETISLQELQLEVETYFESIYLSNNS